MDNVVLLGSLVAVFSAVAGFLFRGLFGSKGKLNKELINAVASGREVMILIDREGVAYKKENNKLNTYRIVLGEEENVNN